MFRAVIDWDGSQQDSREDFDTVKDAQGWIDSQIQGDPFIFYLVEPVAD
jgi:hypothetical protein